MGAAPTVSKPEGRSQQGQGWAEPGASPDRDAPGSLLSVVTGQPARAHGAYDLDAELDVAGDRGAARYGAASDASVTRSAMIAAAALAAGSKATAPKLVALAGGVAHAEDLDA